MLFSYLIIYSAPLHIRRTSQQSCLTLCELFCSAHVCGGGSIQSHLDYQETSFLHASMAKLFP
jgi:hypothetical protein